MNRARTEPLADPRDDVTGGREAAPRHEALS